MPSAPLALPCSLRSLFLMKKVFLTLGLTTLALASAQAATLASEGDSYLKVNSQALTLYASDYDFSGVHTDKTQTQDAQDTYKKATKATSSFLRLRFVLEGKFAKDDLYTGFTTRLESSYKLKYDRTKVADSKTALDLLNKLEGNYKETRSNNLRPTVKLADAYVGHKVFGRFTVSAKGTFDVREKFSVSDYYGVSDYGYREESGLGLAYQYSGMAKVGAQVVLFDDHGKSAKQYLGSAGYDFGNTHVYASGLYQPGSDTLESVTTVAAGLKHKNLVTDGFTVSYGVALANVNNLPKVEDFPGSAGQAQIHFGTDTERKVRASAGFTLTSAPVFQPHFALYYERAVQEAAGTSPAVTVAKTGADWKTIDAFKNVALTDAANYTVQLSSLTGSETTHTVGLVAGVYSTLYKLEQVTFDLGVDGKLDYAKTEDKFTATYSFVDQTTQAKTEFTQKTTAKKFTLKGGFAVYGRVTF